MSWTKEVFIPKYKDKLNGIPERNRGDGFLAIFEALEALDLRHYKIIETGCMRPGYTIEGDGQSTNLFDQFVNYYGGKVLSVDITPLHQEFAHAVTSEKTTVHLGDSVEFLWKHCLVPEMSSLDYTQLFYLDSYDVDFNNPVAANLHHMKELTAISRRLNKGVLVAVDDCRFLSGDPRIPAHINPRTVGKAFFVENFMEDIGAELIFDGYQKVWRI